MRCSRRTTTPAPACGGCAPMPTSTASIAAPSPPAACRPAPAAANLAHLPGQMGGRAPRPSPPRAHRRRRHRASRRRRAADARLPRPGRQHGAAAPVADGVRPRRAAGRDLPHRRLRRRVAARCAAPATSSAARATSWPRSCSTRSATSTGPVPRHRPPVRRSGSPRPASAQPPGPCRAVARRAHRRHALAPAPPPRRRWRGPRHAPRTGAEAARLVAWRSRW